MWCLGQLFRRDHLRHISENTEPIEGASTANHFCVEHRQASLASGESGPTWDWDTTNSPPVTELGGRIVLPVRHPLVFPTKLQESIFPHHPNFAARLLPGIHRKKFQGQDALCRQLHASSFSK